MSPVNRRVVRIVVGLLLAQAVLVVLFVLPVRDPEPHGVPVGVAGPAAAVAPVERALSARGDDFEVHRYPDVAAARAGVRDREVYGAVAPAEGRLLIASAAGPVVAQMLQQGLGRGLEVEDVAPLASGDPRGAILNVLFLPLIVLCLPLAALLGRLRLGRGRLLAAAAGFAALSGLLISAVVGVAMGALPGGYLAVSAVAALIVAAVAFPAVGLMRLLGPAGIGVAALLFVVIGNPGSGNASAPELLPGFWRVAGQLLPPGAGGQALRDVAYFDAGAIGGPLAVLAAWAVAGTALVLLARPRRRPAAEPAPPRAVVTA
jgi:hypothetical protein